MSIDESKNWQFRSVTEAHTACQKLKRQLEEALSIYDAHVNESGANVEVSGSTRITPPQPARIVVYPGQEHYALALDFVKAFEVFKRASGR